MPNLRGIPGKPWRPIARTSNYYSPAHAQRMRRSVTVTVEWRRFSCSLTLVLCRSVRLLVNIGVRPPLLYGSSGWFGRLGISLNVEGEPSFSFKTFGHTHPQGCGGWCPAPRMGRRCPEYYCEVGDALAM